MDKVKDKAKIKVSVDLSFEELISVIKELNKEDQEFLLENMLAAISPEYQESIREAREEYQEGKILSHNEVFRE